LECSVGRCHVASRFAYAVGRRRAQTGKGSNVRANTSRPNSRGVNRCSDGRATRRSCTAPKGYPIYPASRSASSPSALQGSNSKKSGTNTTAENAIHSLTGCLRSPRATVQSCHGERSQRPTTPHSGVDPGSVDIWPVSLVPQGFERHLMTSAPSCIANDAIQTSM